MLLNIFRCSSWCCKLNSKDICCCATNRSVTIILKVLLVQQGKGQWRTRRQEKNNSWDFTLLRPINVKQQRLIRQVIKRTTTEAYLLLHTNCAYYWNNLQTHGYWKMPARSALAVFRPSGVTTSVEFEWTSFLWRQPDGIKSLMIHLSQCYQLRICIGRLDLPVKTLRRSLKPSRYKYEDCS